MSKIDETIVRMEGFIKDIEEEKNQLIEKLTEEGKAQANEFASKTISTITASINKLNEMRESVTNEEELKEFLERLEGKCKDVTEFTKNKINDLKPIVEVNISEIKDNIEKGFDEVKKEFNEKKEEMKADNNSTLNKVLNNENVKNAIELAKIAKEKAIEFYNDPKTQEVLNDAKLKAIDLAEKGLESLKQMLDRVDNKDNTQE